MNLDARATPRALANALAAALVGVSLGACSDGAVERDCTVAADCASGVCLPTGRCAPLGTDDGAAPDGGAGDDAAPATPDGGADGGPAGEDAGGDADAATPPDAGLPPGACKPNSDGVMTRAELPFEAGYEAMFRVTTDIPSGGFDTAAECGGDPCVWDLVAVDGTTADVESVTEALDGKWYAGEPAFADATFASLMTRFDLAFLFFEICAQDQYGVYQLSDDALLLLGIVSEREEDGTKLIYDPPLTIMPLPLELGATWTVETTASGPLCNSWVDYHIDQTAEGAVDAVGEVRTPYGTFEPVLRVNTLLRRHLGVGVVPTRVRTHTFVAECFTSIAAVISEEGVDTPEFDAVAEVRRLANLP